MVQSRYLQLCHPTGQQEINHRCLLARVYASHLGDGNLHHLSPSGRYSSPYTTGDPTLKALRHSTKHCYCNFLHKINSEVNRSNRLGISWHGGEVREFMFSDIIMKVTLHVEDKLYELAKPDELKLKEFVKNINAKSRKKD